MQQQLKGQMVFLCVKTIVRMWKCVNDADKSNSLLGQKKIRALAKACLHLLQFPDLR